MRTLTTPLAAAIAGALLPLAAQAYDLPLRGDSLVPGERFNTFVHAIGIQAEGKDIGAWRRVKGDQWSKFEDGATDSKVLESWVVYGKPFYAMEAGTVVGCWRNAPENEPGSFHPDYKPNLKIPGGGNHLWILQDNGAYALYAHARPGSIPASLCPHNAKLFTGNSGQNVGNPSIQEEAKVIRGARVAKGQKLGEIGNSGSSEGGPHLHVHLEKDGKPIPMNFERGLTTPFKGPNIGSIDGPYTRLAGKPMPLSTILFWPARPIGNLVFNNVPGAEHSRWFAHLADSGMMPNQMTCANDGKTYSTTWMPEAGQWASIHGMSPAVFAEKQAFYTAKGYKLTSSHTCGKVSVAVWKK